MLLFLVVVFAVGEAALEDCFGMECWHGGILQDTEELCRCQCPTGYSGIYCEYELQQSLWPPGPYAIPTPVDGCPETKSQGWTSGFINVTTTRPLDILVSHSAMYNDMADYLNDTEAETFIDIIINSTINPVTLGPFGTFVFQLNFCYKSKDHSANLIHSWPDGIYEIYGSSEGCPIEFKEHNLTHHLPPVLVWNTDGDIPAMTIDFEPDGSAILQLRSCRRIYNNDSYKLYASMWNTPFMVLKDDDGGCTLFEDFTTKQETLMIAMKSDETHISRNNIVIRHCYYTPNKYIYRHITYLSRTEFHGVVLDLSECKSILDVLTNFPEFYEGGTLFDVYISDSKWSFLNNGAQVVRYNIYSSDYGTFIHFLRLENGRYISFVANNINSSASLVQMLNITIITCPSSHDPVVQMVCNRGLGMAGNMIDDFQITASSWQPGYPPEQARLFHAGWCADISDTEAFLQIDLLVPTTVEGVTVYNWRKQGNIRRNNMFAPEVVPMGCRSFQLTYGTHFDSFHETSRQYRLDLSRQYEEPQQFIFRKPFLARYVRIHPEPLLNTSCLKVELIGCKKSVFPSMSCDNDTTTYPVNVSRTFVSVYDPIPLFNETNSTWSDCMTACVNMRNECSSFQHKLDTFCLIYKPSNTYNYQKLINEDQLVTLTTLVCRKKTADPIPFLGEFSNPVDSSYTVVDVDDVGIITNLGYPFHYDLELVYNWHIHFKEGEFIKLILSNLSLHVYEPTHTGSDDTGGCIDTLFITWFSKYSGNKLIALDNRFNGAMMTFSIETKEILLTFSTCIINRKRTVTGYGFRMIVAKTVIPNCFSFYGDKAICDMPMMTLASNSFYHAGNLMADDSARENIQLWIIEGYDTLPIVLTITEFDISCEKGSQLQIGDLFRDGKGVMQPCNNKRPLRRYHSTYNHIILEYTQQHNNFFEGFRASYKFSLKDELVLETTPNITTVVSTGSGAKFEYQEACSEKLQQCYFIYASSFKTDTSWEASRKDCESRDMHLVTIHSRYELRFLRILIDNFVKYKLKAFPEEYFAYFQIPNIDPDLYVHIGLSRYIDTDGILREMWNDGSPLTFTAWNHLEPADVQGRRCTRLRLDLRNKENTWESEGCSTTGIGSAAYYICETSTTEIPPEAARNDLMNYNLRNKTQTLPHMTTENWRFYHCASGDWISRIALCDGIPDCFDRSDEIHCTDIDEDEWYTCNDGSYIHMSDVCNYIPDCLDGSDEYCLYPACNESQFQCANRQCIPFYLRCDAVADCLDASDEVNCVSCNETVAFSCNDLTCIALSEVCDKSEDCSNGLDEMSCEQTIYSTCQEWFEAGYKNNGIYLLDIGEVECQFEVSTDDNKVQVVTFINSTIISDDAWFTALYTIVIPRHFLKIQRCIHKVSVTCTPDMMEVAQHDGAYEGISFSECLGYTAIADLYDFGTTNVTCQYYTNEVTGVKLLVNGTCYFNENNFILNTLPTYGNTRFSFESIICKKEYEIPTERTMACEREQKTIPERKRCFHDLDRSGKIDGCKSLTHLEGCEQHNCSNMSGYLKCPSSFCIPYRFVCDGHNHCTGGEDEINCWCKETETEKIIIYPADTSTEKLSGNVYKLARQLYSPAGVVRVVELRSSAVDPNSTKIVHASPSEVFVTHRVIDLKHQAFQKKETYRINKNKLVNYLIKSHNSLMSNLGIIHIQHSQDSEAIGNILGPPNQPMGEKSVIMYHVTIDPNTNKRVETNDSSFIKYIRIRNLDDIGNIGSTLFPEICENHNESVCYMQYRCRATKVCLPLNQVCDGLKQCFHGDDEYLCDFSCPQKCTCRGFVIRCMDSQFQISDLTGIPRSTRLLDLSINPDLSAGSMNFEDNLYFLYKLNLSNCQLGAISSVLFVKTSNLRILDLSYNLIKRIQSKAFKSLTFLITLVLFGNYQLHSIEAGAFEGLTDLQQLSITGTQLTRIVADTFTGMGSLVYLDLSNNSISVIDDYSFRGVQVETIDFRFNSIKSFSNNMFTDVVSVKNMVTPAYKFCCIRPANVDENDCLPHKDEFSSCEDLMRNPNLQALLWVIGIAAVLGNILSLVYRLKFDKKRLKLGYGIFVTNLAVADFLMGIYLITIAIADLIFRNRYIWMDEYWRNSHWCNMAGILSTISSEASVTFLCLITIDRLLVIKYPFGQVRFGTRSALVASLMTWGFVIVIAFIPIVYSGYFQNKFYSKSGVCLALPLTRDRPPGWVYSVMIFIGLNFVTFVLIAVGQYLLYSEIRSNSRKMKNSSLRRNDLNIARNLLLVVTTDFLCWFPIGVMGMMAMTGHVISGDVYAWTAVLVLPINSAINPLLYTASAISNKRRFVPDTAEQSRISDTNASQGLVQHFLKLWRSPYIRSTEDNAEIKISAEAYVRENKLSTMQLTQITLQLLRCVSCLHKCEMVFGQSIQMEMVTLCFHQDGETFSHVQIERKPIVCTNQSEKQKDVYEIGCLVRKLLTKTEV